MSEWKEYTLQEVGKIITGYTPPTKNLRSWGGVVPFYSPADFNGSVLCVETERTVSAESVIPNRAILPHTIMVTCIGSIGKIALAANAGITNQQINSLVCSEYFDPAFTFYNIKHNINKLNTLYGITTIPIVNKKQFGTIKIAFPPLPIQRKIARILSTIDGQIEKTEAIIAKYQAVKQGMLQDLFTRGIDVRTGQLRPRYEDAPDLYQESALGMIPKEWEVKNVEALSLEVKVGIVIKPTQYYRDTGVPMLRSFNVKVGYILMTDLVFMSPKDNALQAKSRLCVGDVVSVRTGYPGTTAVVTHDIAGCNCIDLVITKVDRELLLPEFLADWTNSTFGMKQIFAKQGGNAQQHFNVGEMKKLLIPAISIQEQQKITKVTQNISLMVSKEADTLAKLQLLKQGLMQDLLSGKREVTL